MTAPAVRHECVRCEKEFEGEPVYDDIEVWWMRGKERARTWCSEDCQINDAEDAHERMLEGHYG